MVETGHMVRQRKLSREVKMGPGAASLFWGRRNIHNTVIKTLLFPGKKWGIM